MTKEERKEYYRQYYLKNKEKIAEYRLEHKEKIAEYRLKNKEKLAEKQRQHRLEHKDEIAKRAKQYYIKNKDKIAEQQRQYFLENKDKITEYQKQYYHTKYVVQLETYFRKNYSRYITLENFISIAKQPNESLKRSVMVRLGRGFIDQNEAIEIAGMPLTDNDHELIREALKSIRRIN